jgi:Fic family protein
LRTWLEFFLVGVIETTESSIETFRKIIALRDRIELTELIKLGKKQQDAKRLINELYKQPIQDIHAVAQLLGIHFSTANRLIGDFVELGILQELTGYKRNRIFAFGEYITLFHQS